MKSRLHLLLLFALLFLFSCHSSVKEKINTVGDAAGETAGEFFKGVGKGIDNALEVKITHPKYITERGLEFGKTTVSSNGGTDNVLSVYILFKKDFKGRLTSKVFDTKGQETGRTAADVEGKAGEARFTDFVFDTRTNIDSDYRITIE